MNRCVGCLFQLFSLAFPLFKPNHIRYLSRFKAVVSGAMVLVFSLPAIAITSNPATSNNGSYTLTWSSSSLSSNYKLYEQVNGGAWILLGDVTSRNGSYPFTGKAGGSYGYRLDYKTCMPMNPSSCSNNSENVTVTVNLPPAAPASINVNTDTANTTFSISWPGVSGAITRYELQNNGANIYSGMNLSHTLTGIARGQYYIIQVRACSSIGCSPWRATSSIRMPYLAPSVPTSITAPQFVVEDEPFSIQWGPASGVVSEYRLERKIGSGSWTQIYAGTQMSFTETVSSGPLSYQVKACNADACSGYRTSASLQYIESNLDDPAVIVPATSAGTLNYQADVDYKGDSSITVPITLIPGVSGVEPSLQLAYSSGRERQNMIDGIVDTLRSGWSLSGISEIRMCRKAPLGEGMSTGTGSNAGTTVNNLRFCLDGEPLVLATPRNTNMQDGAIYYPWRNSSVKVLVKGMHPDTHFEVYMPDGSVREYGNTVASQTREWETMGGSDTENQLQWSINKETDPFGNTISYEYFKNSKTSQTTYGSRTTETNYPKHIQYGNNNDVKVDFQYLVSLTTPADAHRIPSTFIGDFVLLNRISIKLDNAIVREYRFENPGSQLSRVQMCGYQNNLPDCMAPLTINWYSQRNVVSNISNGLGATTTFEYAMLAPSNSDGRFTEKPFGDAIAPNPDGEEAREAEFTENYSMYQTVTTRIRRSNGIGGWHDTEYAYQGPGLMSKANFGFIGFYAQRMKDVASGIVTYRQFRWDRPFVGKVSRELQLNGIFGSHTETLAKAEYDHKYNFTMYSSRNGITKETVMPYVSTATKFIYEGGNVMGVQQTKTELTMAGNLLGGIITTVTHAKEAIEATPANTTVWGGVPDYTLSYFLRSQQSTTTFSNRTSTNQWLVGFVSENEQRHYRGSTNATLDYSEKTTFTPYNATSNEIGSQVNNSGDAEYELTTSYLYSNTGQVTDNSISGANIESRTSSIGQYKSGRYPQLLTNPLSQTMQLDYDLRFGKANRVTDANTRVTQSEFDVFGRTISVTTPEGVTVNTRYENCAQVYCAGVNGITPAMKVTTTSAITPVQIDYIDTLGRVIRQEGQGFDGRSIYLDTLYDNQGRVQRVSLPYFAGDTPVYSTYTYDIRNRVLSITNPDGTQVITDYTYQSATKHALVAQTQQVKSASGASLTNQVQHSEYNVSGDLVKTVDAANTSQSVSTSFTYNGSGLPLSSIVNAGSTGQTQSVFTYDLAGNRRTLTDPNLGTVTTYYNALHQPRWERDNKQQITTSHYDRMGRIKEQRFHDGTLAEWAYDPTNGVGKLARRSMSTSSYSFSEDYIYNYQSQLQQVTTAMSAGSLIRNYTQQFTYDTYGRPETATTPSGLKLRQYYNNYGYLSTVTDYISGANLQSFTRFNALGQLEQESFGNGITTSRQYNPLTGNLESLQSVRSSQTLQNNTYRWRSNGLLESRLDSVNQREERAAYDDLDRLTGTAIYAVGGSTPLRSLTTNYNLFGNITSKTSSVNGDTQVSGYQYGTNINSNQAGPHALKSAVVNGINNTFIYDANGNITTYIAASGNSKFIEWNVRNLPTRITKGTSASQVNPNARNEFYYGPDGERFYRKSSWMDGSSERVEHTFYLGSFEERVAANDPTYASIQKTRVSSNIVHIKAVTHLNTTESRVEYALTDHLGSVEAVVDQQGDKLFSLAYDPFGERKKPNGQSNYSASELNTLLSNLNVRTSRGFTEHEHLDRTGIIHMNGRIYDPQLGRFLSPDPLVEAPTFSQSHNRYSYVFNSPLVYTDPTGYHSSLGMTQEASGIPNIDFTGEFMASYTEEVWVRGRLRDQLRNDSNLNSLSFTTWSVTNSDYNWVYVGNKAYNMDIFKDQMAFNLAMANEELATALQAAQANSIKTWNSGAELLSALVAAYNAWSVDAKPDCKNWVNHFLKENGLKDYAGRANDMAETLSKENVAITLAEAVEAAKQGVLVIVALLNKGGTGHVAFLHPESGTTQRTGRVVQSSSSGNPKLLGSNIYMNWAYTPKDFGRLKYYKVAE